MGDPETLAAVQAAVQQVGAQAGPVFAAGEQSGYTVEQLRAYLRQNGIQGSARIDRLRTRAGSWETSGCSRRP